MEISFLKKVFFFELFIFRCFIEQRMNFNIELTSNKQNLLNKIDKKLSNKKWNLWNVVGTMKMDEEIMVIDRSQELLSMIWKEVHIFAHHKYIFFAQ